MLPKLNGIDHIHLNVPNKSKAADWYKEILGLSVDQQYDNWNTNKGPLMLKNDDDNIHLALFESDNFTPTDALALNASGKDFLLWKQHLQQHNLLNRYSDHQLSLSLYFNDPFGHQHEITTKETDYVRTKLNEQ
ncbi:VOC family protein [Pleionea mediterranea]|uniref:Glyoxalase/bleomycin resistance protein/dioxygenase superfamily protein n=1 Tax=Pleionea mediterranea TaxID=523701 RepID=A0A316FVJ1_9GAMM|nr:VOC family protein [Pleionea mediterranea]PWK52804.1 glyoxalase/bleomycin resistance protein/dioxygenase superfamily protein [Pleionea mediterranea]